jgi:hypothetical protein
LDEVPRVFGHVVDLGVVRSSLVCRTVGRKRE